tara:strand:+ start:454 stop:765 length:312 start_codon:yes stop_codon:yes gene_type:complete
VVGFKKKKEMKDDMINQQAKQNIEAIENKKAIDNSIPDPNAIQSINTFQDPNMAQDPSMLPNATTNPYSNGTGSARPVFGEPTQDALGQVKQGVAMKKVLFKK